MSSFLTPIVHAELKAVLRKHPKVMLCAGFVGENLEVSVWNPDETRLLKKITLAPAQQTEIVVRNLEFFSGMVKP